MSSGYNEGKPPLSNPGFERIKVVDAIEASLELRAAKAALWFGKNMELVSVLRGRVDPLEMPDGTVQFSSSILTIVGFSLPGTHLVDIHQNDAKPAVVGYKLPLSAEDINNLESRQDAGTIGWTDAIIARKILRTTFDEASSREALNSMIRNQTAFSARVIEWTARATRS